MRRFSWLAVLAVGSSLGVRAFADDDKDQVKPQHGGMVITYEGSPVRGGA